MYILRRDLIRVSCKKSITPLAVPQGMIYFSVFIFLVAGSLFFWWWGDRHLRPLRKALVWRSLLAVLVGGQTLVLSWWIMFPGTLRSLGNSFWKPVTAWLYMWHLLVLPTTLLALLFAYSVYC